MENVTDALKLAAWVLIFVLALSISISAFGQARSTADAIISYRDRENDFFYVESTRNNRTVGIETVIPSMYRAIKENYIIQFKNLSAHLYRYKTSENTWEPFDYIDAKQLSDWNIKIEDILYKSGTDELSKVEYFNIYQIFMNRRFTEELGEYIEDDESQASQNNSVKKRIIKYTMQ